MSEGVHEGAREGEREGERMEGVVGCQGGWLNG